MDDKLHTVEAAELFWLMRQGRKLLGIDDNQVLTPDDVIEEAKQQRKKLFGLPALSGAEDRLRRQQEVVAISQLIERMEQFIREWRSADTFDDEELALVLEARRMMGLRDEGDIGEFNAGAMIERLSSFNPRQRVLRDTLKRLLDDRRKIAEANEARGRR